MGWLEWGRAGGEFFISSALAMFCELNKGSIGLEREIL